MESVELSEYQFSETELKAFAEVNAQMQQLVAMRNGMLQLIAFQQGITGGWKISDDGKRLIKNGVAS